jgi:ADP-heptose:LPS heptosyltransferase
MRILVIRNSAMGDVALVAPVVKAFTDFYTKHEIVLVTRKAFHPFFSGIDRVQLIDTDYENRHKGISGIYQLYKDISNTGKIDVVVDLHGVVRSKILRNLFKLQGAVVSVIDKYRKERRDLITGKSRTPIKHTVLRYADTFFKAGFPVEMKSFTGIYTSESANRRAKDVLIGEDLKIGIAPFARHALKQWPVSEMKALMQLISANRKVQFYLLGGKSEKEALEEMVTSNSTVLAGKYSLEEELGIISKLDFVISMDSSNMHMSVLVGTPVIAIWGATDPLAGFGPWGHHPDRNISNLELNCRPCSIYGKGTCARKDFACMTQLRAQTVYQKIIENHFLSI